MALRILSTADKGARVLDSYSRGVVKLGKTLHGVWWGYATVLKGASYASLDILIPAQQRGLVDTKSMIIDANSRIVSVSMCPRGPLTLGTATGKLKFAPSLTAATAALYVESAAATGGVLPLVAPVETLNTTATTVGSSDVTYRIYATDGGAGGAAVASTMTASVDTIIDIEIGFNIPGPFPTRLEVGKAAPPL